MIESGAYVMKKWEGLVEYLQEKGFVERETNKEEKEANILLWILAIIGAVAAVAAIAYAVYRYMTPDYLNDFEDEFDDDFEDDFFDDEEDEEPAKEDEKSVE